MAQHVLNKILAQSKESKQIIGVHNKGDDDFWAGYVLDYNDNYVVIQHLSKFGLKDGIIVMQLEDIDSIETDDDYLNALWLLLDNPLADQTVKKGELPTGEGWQLEMLKANPTPGKIVAFDISNNQFIYGIVKEFDDEHVSIRRVGSSGADEGIVFYKIEDINSAHFDNLEARKRQKLYEWNVGGRVGR